MNRPLRNVLLAVSAACLFSNCATTASPGGRIEKHPGMYTSLSSKHQEAVKAGRLVEGMSKDAVYLAWGRPSAIKKGSSSGKTLEKWRYVGHQPVISNHFGYGYGGYGRGRYCDAGYYDFGHSVDYIPYTAAVVEFRSDKVVGWERESR